MKIGLVIQARCSSSRLPGKVLRNMAGKPMIVWLIERLKKVKKEAEIIISTSKESEDDSIALLAEDYGISYYRGPLEDVLSRFVETKHQFKLDAIVRVNGDSPLLDPVLVDKGIAIFTRQQPDLVSNVWPRSYPKGQSVEIISGGTLELIGKVAVGNDREHITGHIYHNSKEFKICSFSKRFSSKDVQLSVDTEKDFKLIENLLVKMKKPHWEYGFEECLKLYETII